MLRLEQDEKQAFLRGCLENIQRIHQASLSPLPELIITPQHIKLEAEMGGLLDNKLISLIHIYNKVAATSHGDITLSLANETKALNVVFDEEPELDLALLKFLYQFNYAHWMDDETRILFRNAVAIKELRANFDDANALEKALRAAEWYTDAFISFKTKNSLSTLEAILQYDKEDEIIRAWDKDKINDVLDEEELLQLSPKEKIILGAAIIGLEFRYYRQDTALAKADNNQWQLALRPITKGKLLKGKLSEILPKIKEISQVGHNRERLPYAPELNNGGKGKEDAVPYVPWRMSSETAARYFDGYYSYRRVEIPVCEYNTEAFARDFISGRFTLNNKKHLGFEDAEINTKIPKEEIDAAMRRLIDPGVSVTPETLTAVSAVLNQSLLVSGPGQSLMKASMQSDLKVVWPNGENENYDDVVHRGEAFTLIVKNDEEIYVKADCRHYKFPIKMFNSQWESETVGYLDASLEVTYQLKRNGDGSRYFEMVESWSDNEVLAAIIKANMINVELQREMVARYCDSGKVDELNKDRARVVSSNNKSAVKKPIPVTYDTAVQRLEELIDESASSEVGLYVSAYEILNKQVRNALKSQAKSVLLEVKKMHMKRLPKISEEELTTVLQQTIKLIETPAYSGMDENGRTERNHHYSDAEKSYARTAGKFQKSGKKKILVGAMIALLGVAMIVGCAMLIASTFGAGAAIGIPVLVASQFVPHFTAGMAIGTLLGTGLGFFGTRAISRGVSDIKLANAMAKMVAVNRP